MEVLFVIFVIAAIAYDIVIFIEIEKLLDNSFELGHAVQRINRRLIRKGKK